MPGKKRNNNTNKLGSSSSSSSAGSTRSLKRVVDGRVAAKKMKNEKLDEATGRYLLDAECDALSEFVRTGRTGRRNALPVPAKSAVELNRDPVSLVTVSDLPDSMAKMSCANQTQSVFNVMQQPQHVPLSSVSSFGSNLGGVGNELGPASPSYSRAFLSGPRISDTNSSFTFPISNGGGTLSTSSDEYKITGCRLSAAPSNEAVSNGSMITSPTSNQSLLIAKSCLPLSNSNNNNLHDSTSINQSFGVQLQLHSPLDPLQTSLPDDEDEEL